MFIQSGFELCTVYYLKYLYFNVSVDLPNNVETQSACEYNVIILYLLYCKLRGLTTNNLKLKQL